MSKILQGDRFITDESVRNMIKVTPSDDAFQQKLDQIQNLKEFSLASA